MENIFKKYKNQLPEIISLVYRKLKSYIYYSNNILYAKKMIADFEYNDSKMESVFAEIADYLSADKVGMDYIEKLVKKVSYKVLPKVSVEKNNSNGQIVSNSDETEIKISNVNFFFDAPIELWILDAFWALIIGYYLEKEQIIPVEVKANRFNFDLFTLNSGECLNNINFNSLSIFVPYFDQYKKWKNGAVYCMDSMYDRKEDSLLFSLDISSYYYSVNFQFEKLYNDLSNNGEIISKFSRLNETIEMVYNKYTQLITQNRADICTDSLILPIGLVSAAVLGNYCLVDFDKKIINEKKPVYYARYVDDILILFENDKQVKSDDVFIYVNNYMSGLFEYRENKIYFTQYENIYIQNNKIKIIKTNSKGSKAELKLLIEQINNTSEVNLLPNKNLNLEGFYESIYEQHDDNIKIREINNVSIDKYRLMNFISSFLMLNRNTQPIKRDSFYKMNEQKAKKSIKTQFQQIDFETRKQLNILFKSNSIFELYNRWDRFFLFLLLSSEYTSDVDEVYNNLKAQILNSRLIGSDKIILSKRNFIEKKLTEGLLENLYIALSMALAVRSAKVACLPSKNLYKRIKKANMFDHAMVSCPLVNYIEGSNNYSFHYLAYSDYFKFIENPRLDKRKIKYSPRFIHMREYYIYKSIFFINEINNDDFLTTIKKEYAEIREKIGAGFCNIELFEGKSCTSKQNYLINTYSISSKGKRRDDDAKFNIALANINIEKTKILNKNKLVLEHPSSDYKFKIYQLLEEVSEFNKNENNSNIRFLVFPELAIPIEWVNELAKYVQATGVAIVCGLRYFNIKNRIYNLVATILPITSYGGYRNAIVILREKNDYAPLEKRIIENQKLVYNQSDVSRYDLIDFNGVKFSVFNCYELTDIFARANIRDKIDLLFAIEYNEDIGYFSNIVESSCRDMYAFVVQVNSSNFGDTRIIGPFDDKRKDIAHIKGGELDLVHVGQINLKEFWQYLNFTKTEAYNKSLDKQLKYKNESKKDKFKKYKKMSAKTKK